MKTYHVSWEIEVEATNRLGAALVAQRWMEDADTMWVFTVTAPDGKQYRMDLDGYPEHVERTREGRV
jgi:hypothetical protein